MFHIFGALPEFERNIIQERIHAGLAAARARGRQGGRPSVLDAKKQTLLYKRYDERQHAIKEICGVLDISRPTLYAYLHRREQTEGRFKKVEKQQ